MNNVEVIGQMDNTIDNTFESANRVYSDSGLSPTIPTCGGGGLQPKILEVGYMDNGTGKHQSNTVYDENGLCPNITTIEGGGTQQIKICTESQILTSKRTEYGKSIRKAYEHGEVKESWHNMKELKPREDGISNTLTTVQHDNMVLVRQATKCGSIECEVGGCFDASYPESKTRRGRVQDNGNISPTLTAQNQEIVRIEKVGQISNDGSQYGTVISDNGIASNLVAGTHGYANNCIQTQYRIRKLTPRECGRLMAVSDEDIDKILGANSDTQAYKQFGNSIVVDVMCAMFRNLNIKQK